MLTTTDGRGTATAFTYDPTGMVLTESQPTAAGRAVKYTEPGEVEQTYP